MPDSDFSRRDGSKYNSGVYYSLTGNTVHANLLIIRLNLEPAILVLSRDRTTLTLLTLESGHTGEHGVEGSNARGRRISKPILHGLHRARLGKMRNHL